MRVGSSGPILAVVVLCFMPTVAMTDGGVVAMSESSGPFVITVFISPSPLTTGPADVTVMVQDGASQQQVLDAEVAVRLTRANGSVVVSSATREQSQNRMLYGALMDVPESGRWQLQVSVSRGGRTAIVTSPIDVAEPWPPLLAYWRFLAIPPLVVALFLANQFLRRRRSRSDRGDRTAA